MSDGYDRCTDKFQGRSPEGNSRGRGRDHLTQSLNEEVAKDHLSCPRCVGLPHLCAPMWGPEWRHSGRNMDLQQSIAFLGLMHVLCMRWLFTYIYSTYIFQFCFWSWTMVRIRRRHWGQSYEQILRRYIEKCSPGKGSFWASWGKRSGVLHGIQSEGEICPLFSQSSRWLQWEETSQLTDGQENKYLGIPWRKKRWIKGVQCEGGPAKAKRKNPLPGSSQVPHTEHLPLHRGAVWGTCRMWWSESLMAIGSCTGRETHG